MASFLQVIPSQASRRVPAEAAAVFQADVGRAPTIEPVVGGGADPALDVQADGPADRAVPVSDTLARRKAAGFQPRQMDRQPCMLPPQRHQRASEALRTRGERAVNVP